MLTGKITVLRDGPIARVLIDRPEKLNAMTREMWRELGDDVRALDENADLRCLILSGAGKGAFSPGNDIAEFPARRASPGAAREYDSHVAHALDALTDCRHPLVAQIQGACVGGGLVIACCCDIRVSAASGRFGIPIARLGLVLGHREMARVMRLVGPATLSELLLEGRLFNAQEACGKGLVHRVVADEDLENESLGTARRIAQGGPLAARWHKKFIRRLEDPVPLSEAERAEGYACYETRDFARGYRAFLDKKKPEFQGD
jgi:enoyl-CoA hydratase/carnithine racemase